MSVYFCEENQIGVVNGMAYTSIGGDLLKIEASVMKGTGKLQLTGKLGEVMRESCEIAVSVIRQNAEKLGIYCGRDIIIEKLKVSIKNYREDPKIIWDKILEHRFFQFRPRLLIDLVFDELPKVNDDKDIHDDYKGEFLWMETGSQNNENYMRITLQQPDGNFTFRISRVQTFLEMFNIDVLEKILEYLDSNFKEQH